MQRQWDYFVILTCVGALFIWGAAYQFISPVTPFEEVVTEVSMLGKNNSGLYAEWKPRFHLYTPESFAKNDTKLLADLKAFLNQQKVANVTPGSILEAAYETDDFEKITVYVRYTNLFGNPNPVKGTEVPVMLSVLEYTAKKDEAEAWAVTWRDLARGMRTRNKAKGTSASPNQSGASVPGQINFNGTPSRAPAVLQVGTTTIN